MSAEHERILIGSNRIRAYIGDQLHWELVPHGFSMLQTDVTGTIAMSNPSTGSPTITYKLWRLGSLRILSVATYIKTTISGAMATSVALAAGDRPAEDVYEEIITVDGTTTAAGYALLTATTGILSFAPTYASTSWTGSAGDGFYSFMMMYDTAHLAHHNGF